MSHEPPLPNPQQEYLEILSLTRQFLSQEFPSNDFIVTQPDSHAYFKDFTLPPKKTEPLSPRAPHFTAPLISPTPPTPKKSPSPPSPTPPSSPIEKSVMSPEISTAPAKEKKEAENLAKSIPIPKAEFQLERLGKPSELDLKEFATLMQSHFPGYRIHSSIPKPKVDPQPKTKENLAPVVILSFYQDQESQMFLKNVAQAIQNKLLPAIILPALRIEQEKKWDALFQSPSLRLILVPTHRIHELPLLQQYYKPELNRLHLTPIISMSDPVEYSKSSSLKLQLWQAITQALKPS